MRFRTTLAAATLAVALPLATPVIAQGLPPSGATLPNLPTGTEVSVQARITNINARTRVITLRGPSGNRFTVTAGDGVRLELLKTGDIVNLQYYRSVAFLVGSPKDPVPDDAFTAILARKATAPGGAAVAVTRISATVVGIDLAAHSVDVVDPTGGAVYTINVQDPARQAMLAQLKVGDTVTAAVSQALAISVTPAPRRWFRF